MTGPDIQNESGRSLPRGLRDLLVGAFHIAGRAHGDPRADITVRFVNDAEMRELNRRYKKKDRATDVLAFETGDIVVSVDTAERQCREQEHSLRRELIHLAVHGLLHLQGHRDDTSARRGSMEKETIRILDQSGAT